MKYILLCALLATAVHADSKVGDEPYFAGTQLAAYPLNSSPGHFSINPFVAYITSDSSYNSHWSKKSGKSFNKAILYNSMGTGITDWLDTSIYFGNSFQKSGSHSRWGMVDTSLYFGIQLLQGSRNDWIPDMRILLGETFPTGKYDRLDPHKKWADLFGRGSYASSFTFLIARTFYNNPRHPFNINLNLSYVYSSSVHVDGISYYGGDTGTSGRVFPKASYYTDLALQLSLNQFLTLGLDIYYVHENKTRFHGKSTLKPILPSTDQLSLAPCLGYSWNGNSCFGIGPWFSIAGRNTSAFFGLLGNAYWYF